MVRCWKLETSENLEDVKEKVKHYKDSADFYYNNSQSLLSKKEYSKAGEFLWGAIAETSKAISLLYGKPLTSHQAIRKFLSEITLTFNDKIKDEYRLAADQMHTNFYEADLEESDFKTIYEKARLLFIFLTSLLKENMEKAFKLK